MTTVNVQSEVDSGTSGPAPTWRAPLISPYRRMSGGVDTIQTTDAFNATAQNTAAWKSAATTYSFGFTGGYVVFNNGSVTTASAAQIYQSTRTYPLAGQSPLIADFSGQVTAALPLNTTIELGFFSADLTSTPFTPTDGVFYRLTSAGAVGVLSYGGVETVTAVIYPAAAVVPNSNLNFRIIITQDFVEFWGADTTGIQAMLIRVATPAANGQPSSSAALPISFRQANSATAASASQQLKISDVTVTMGDISTNKPWAHQMAGDGQMAYQGQNGGTMGSTALYTNSLAAGTGAVMTNTTAALGTGLGGQFSALPTLAAGSDGILCSYQNPANTTSVTGRTLYITGVKIQGAVTTVLVGNATPTIFALSLAYGHTAVSMATAEAAAAKAPRRIALGYETYAAAAALGAVGSQNGVYMPFASPVTVNAGEFIAICAKNVGVVTVSGVITFLVTFDGYYE